MPTTSTPAGAVLDELLSKYPDWPARRLARIAYAEHPKLWPSIDACRSAIRGRLGVMGKAAKNKYKKTFFREPRQAGWADVIPESISQLGDWKPFIIKGAQRTLILADIHIPFHDAQALEIALQYGAERDPTLIILNGDICDHYALSKFQTDPELRDFPAEVRAVKYFLSGLRKRFPKTRIICKHGNHEERFEVYMRMKCIDFLGIPEFEWINVFGLKGLDIELVTQMRPIRLGKLNVIHGHEHRYAISNPVNPARGLLLRAKTNAICGHFHQESKHTGKSLEQKVISTWSTGCLCDLHPAYLPLNEWCHGAAYVESDKDGGFLVNNFKIIDGKIW